MTGVTFADAVERIVVRAIEDAVTQSLPTPWLRRADAFEAARPRPGDFTGNATADELADRDARLAGLAEACRQHAELVRGVRPWWLSETLTDVLAEVAADAAA